MRHNITICCAVALATGLAVPAHAAEIRVGTDNVVVCGWGQITASYPQGESFGYACVRLSGSERERLIVMLTTGPHESTAAMVEPVGIR